MASSRPGVRNTCLNTERSKKPPRNKVLSSSRPLFPRDSPHMSSARKNMQSTTFCAFVFRRKQNLGFTPPIAHGSGPLNRAQYLSQPASGHGTNQNHLLGPRQPDLLDSGGEMMFGRTQGSHRDFMSVRAVQLHQHVARHGPAL